MLISQITPTATKVKVISPFSSTTESLSFMTAVARPYIVGSEKTTFQIIYGNVVTDKDDKITGFKEQETQRIVLTSDELSTWGTNDETLLEIIASKLGITVVRHYKI
jgi:hypothetical protein